MFVKAAVIADHRRNAMRRVQDLPPWPRTAELKALQGRIKEATRRYEAGEYRDASRYFSSLDRMEIDEAELKAELRAYSREQDARAAALWPIWRPDGIRPNSPWRRNKPPSPRASPPSSCCPPTRASRSILTRSN